MKSNTKTICFLSLVVVPIVGLCGYNAFRNETFFEINIGTAIAALIAIVISYFLAQNATDERKKKEIIDDLICQIKSLVSDDCCYLIDDNANKETILSKTRNIANCISVLKRLDFKNIDKTNVDYISKEFDQYNDLIGEHIDDLSYLRKSNKELQNHIRLIDNKLDEIRFKLYNLSEIK